MNLGDGLTLAQAIFGALGAVAAFAGSYAAMRAEQRAIRREHDQFRADVQEWQRVHLYQFHLRSPQ